MSYDLCRRSDAKGGRTMREKEGERILPLLSDVQAEATYKSRTGLQLTPRLNVSDVLSIILNGPRRSDPAPSRRIESAHITLSCRRTGEARRAPPNVQNGTPDGTALHMRRFAQLSTTAASETSRSCSSVGSTTPLTRILTAGLRQMTLNCYVNFLLRID